ncbi:hypothetical protein D3C84_1220090 [compost metagenome]
MEPSKLLALKRTERLRGIPSKQRLFTCSKDQRNERKGLVRGIADRSPHTVVFDQPAGNTPLDDVQYLFVNIEQPPKKL